MKTESLKTSIMLMRTEHSFFSKQKICVSYEIVVFYKL